jgi:hypothetical protein
MTSGRSRDRSFLPLLPGNACYSILEPVYLRKYHPSSLRWIFYHQLFTSSSKFTQAFDHILVADVRDTAFQSNPFSYLPKPPQGNHGHYWNIIKMTIY